MQGGIIVNYLEVTLVFGTESIKDLLIIVSHLVHQMFNIAKRPDFIEVFNHSYICYSVLTPILSLVIQQQVYIHI